MIVLDTHIWIWWVHDHPSLKTWMRDRIQAEEPSGLCLSAISLWEIARLVSLNRLVIDCPMQEWFELALSYPGIHLIGLSPAICTDANNLPGGFHKDPADRLIVATARTLDCELMTADNPIQTYSGVRIAKATG